jgi:hypothetical protein
MSDLPSADRRGPRGSESETPQQAAPEPEGTELAVQEVKRPEPEIPERERPGSAGQAGPLPLCAGHERSWWKKYWRSVILGGLGLAMLPAGFLIYPSIPEAPAPGYSQLVITSKVPVGLVEYAATQISAVTAEITVRVSLAPGTSSPSAASLQVWPPYGTTFLNCRAPACRDALGAGISGAYWTQELTFMPVGDSFQAIPVVLLVHAEHFGAVFNDVTASAVIPEVSYYAPSTPAQALLAGYKIPSAASYDWSSFQPQSFTKGFTVWAEDFSVGDTQSRVAVGINHGAQSHDDFMIFLAGAVIALGGAAILAAIQEALHAGDKEVLE